VAAEVTKLASDIAGVLGEHITDYHCAEILGWGDQWQGHDKGSAGKWSGATPGKHTEGKLSNKTHLFRLGIEANGQGIDAVWRANSNNSGKPYAIVEAKSEIDLLKKMPAFLKKDPNSKRKPAIAGRLGVNGIPKAVELLEPYDDSKKATATPNAGGRAGRSGKPQSRPSPLAASMKPSNIVVQMSHEWIRQSIGSALDGKDSIINDVKKHGYSRHIFYAAMWTESAREHGAAVVNGTTADSSTHANHALPDTVHYQDHKVKEAVNQRKAALRKKYGNLPSLQAEA